MQYLYEYGWIVILSIIFIAWLIVIYKKNGWDAVLTDLRIVAYQLMLYAERSYPDGAGRTKFLIVLNNTYPLLPKSMRVFLSEEQFAKTLQKWYDDAKDFLDNGIMDDSAKPG